MGNFLATFTILSTLTLAACGPCETGDRVALPGGVIVADDVCNGDDDGTSIATATDGASETGAEPTAAESSSTGGDAPPPVCTALPGPGEAWGPCVDGGCNPGAGFCLEGEFGTLCMPGCDDGCPMFKCFGGTCRADGACIPPCADDSDCPIPGMQCDKDAPQFPTCVHPA